MKKLAMMLLACTCTAFGQKSGETFQIHTDPTNWIKVHNGNSVGIIDQETGLEVVPPIYDDIQEFGVHSSNFALVVKDGLCGFIDADGNIIVPLEYEEIQKFGAYRDDWALIKKEGRYGFIDQSGYEIVKPKYDSIEDSHQILKVQN